MIVNLHAYNSLSSVDKITPRIMVMNLHGNPQILYRSHIINKEATKI